MTFSVPEDPPDLNDLFMMSQPAATCTACGDRIQRRQHRVWVRATWRAQRDILCPECWGVICEWAKRFALQQLVWQELTDQLN